jgi:hypothetical protein
MHLDEALSYLLLAENSDAQAALYSKDGNNFPLDFEFTLIEKIKAHPDGEKFLAWPRRAAVVQRGDGRHNQRGSRARRRYVARTEKITAYRSAE